MAIRLIWVLSILLIFTTGCSKKNGIRINPKITAAQQQQPPNADDGSGDSTNPSDDNSGLASGDATNSSDDDSKACNSVPAADATKISVMSFNMENLFDELKDDNGHDEKEGPVDIELLNKKYQQLALAVLQVNKGRGPDVLLVQEVENLRVIEVLNRDFLKAAGYKTVELIIGDDERGINVGILSRLDKGAETKIYRMPFSDVNKTRGVLQSVLVTPDNKKLNVFTFHFPSQFNPSEQREQAAKYVASLMDKVPCDQAVVSGGDSNVTTKEETDLKIFSGVFKNYEVSHLVGCKGCKGTEYYSKDKKWNFFDVLVTRKNHFDKASIMIPNKSKTQAKTNGTPYRFDKKTGEGVSDHFPIFAEILL